MMSLKSEKRFLPIIICVFIEKKERKKKKSENVMPPLRVRKKKRKRRKFSIPSAYFTKKGLLTEFCLQEFIPSYLNCLLNTVTSFIHINVNKFFSSVDIKFENIKISQQK